MEGGGVEWEERWRGPLRCKEEGRKKRQGEGEKAEEKQAAQRRRRSDAPTGPAGRSEEGERTEDARSPKDER